MILLELTEKEFEMVQLAVGTAFIANSEAYDTNKQEVNRKRMDTYNAVLSKLELSSKPKEDVLITSKDLSHLKSLAKGEYHRLPGNLQISNKTVEQEDFVHISLANAVVMWLNSKDLLKRVARFDYTDDSFEYEESE